MSGRSGRDAPARSGRAEARGSIAEAAGRWFALLLAASPLGCVEAPALPGSPALAQAPGGALDDENARRAAAVATARRDLACDTAVIALALDRRYMNSTTARYVVEGCGRRALYVEACEIGPLCRYLLVSVVAAAPP